MAAGTDVVIREGASQFRGVFDRIWVVTFTLDTGSISGNDSAEDTTTVPGIRRATDVVLGFTHTTEPAGHDVLDEVHVGADDTLHVIRHNQSGAPVDPTSTSYRVVLARVV